MPAPDEKPNAAVSGPLDALYANPTALALITMALVLAMTFRSSTGPWKLFWVIEGALWMFPLFFIGRRLWAILMGSTSQGFADIHKDGSEQIAARRLDL
jgi:hypothetical protein